MLKNMKIRGKLIAAFIAVALLTAIAGVVGLVLMSKMDIGYSAALVNNGFVQGDIGDYNTYLNKGGAIVRDIILLTDPAEVQASQAELDDAKAHTDTAFAAVVEKCTTPAEVALLDRINVAYPQYAASRDKAVELGLQNKNDEALKLFREEARPHLNECMEAGQELMLLNEKLGEEVSASLSKQSNTGMLAMIAIIAISLIVSLLLSWFVSRGISEPIKLCAARLEKLAAGDLKATVPVIKSKDETGTLANATGAIVGGLQSMLGDVIRLLEEMSRGNFDVATNAEDNYVGDFRPLLLSVREINGRLSSTLSQINEASDQVSSGSDQVSSGAQALSQGATEQASSVEELAATISEISQQVKSNADNAQIAREKTTSAGNEVGVSNEKMTQLIGAMGEISSSSQEIGKVIKTIEDIAFQTNILALNAAVEAARAGAAGKGFAVVADEVRNLASKSAEAAKGTTALIEGAIKAVANGTSLVDDTAKSLLSVVDGTNEVSAIVDKIAYASGEQASSIAQVTQGIEQISAVVQTNSATSEESAAASEELSGQAQMLKELVGKFTLKRMGPGQSSSVRQQQPSTQLDDAAPRLTYEEGKY